MRGEKRGSHAREVPGAAGRWCCFLPLSAPMHAPQDAAAVAFVSHCRRNALPLICLINRRQHIDQSS